MLAWRLDGGADTRGLAHASSAHLAPSHLSCLLETQPSFLFSHLPAKAVML